MKKILNYINGEFKSALDGEILENISPRTGKVYSTIPHSKSADVDFAVESAKKAFPAWSQTSPQKRSEILKKISTLLLENVEQFAEAETIDNGKPIKGSRSIDIPRSSENFDFFSSAILNFTGEIFPEEKKGKNSVSYSPLGVVACISPWNLPLYLFTWKVAPALAAGCTVVAKPSEVTPMTAFMLGEICSKAGLPPGVLNIVHGLGSLVGEAMSAHPEIKAISFTGSTLTGRLIAKRGAATMKRLHLEMGGKNPTIIFSDCDFQKSLNGALSAGFSNQGQICLCGSRIFVEKSIYEKFKLALIEKINGLVQGDPLASSSDQGAVVSKEHFEKIMKAIELAKNEGGIILTGGVAAKLPGELSGGYYIKPTLIEGLGPYCETNQKEIFGPVATIASFETIDEVITYANSTDYGLAASVWTQDQIKANEVSKRLEAGIVWINTWMLRDLRTPFGGVKESGRGREGGKYILEFFSNVKNICEE